MNSRIFNITLAVCLAVLPSIAYADKCPGPADIAALFNPGSTFVGRLWEFSEAKDTGGNKVSGSLLGFEKEELETGSINLIGHIWWMNHGKFVGCEKIKGRYNIATRTFNLYGTKSTGPLLKPSIYEIVILENNSEIEGRWGGNLTYSGKLKGREVRPKPIVSN